MQLNSKRDVKLVSLKAATFLGILRCRGYRWSRGNAQLCCWVWLPILAFGLLSIDLNHRSEDVCLYVSAAACPNKRRRWAGRQCDTWRLKIAEILSKLRVEFDLKWHQDSSCQWFCWRKILVVKWSAEKRKKLEFWSLKSQSKKIISWLALLLDPLKCGLKSKQTRGVPKGRGVW